MGPRPDPIRSVFLLATVLLVFPCFTLDGASADALSCSDFLLLNAIDLRLVVANVPFGTGFDASTDPTCRGAQEAQLLVADQVVARWFHDEAGLVDVQVALDGPGIDPAPRSMIAIQYLDGGDGLREKTLYESPSLALPPSFQGSVTATLLRGGAPVASASLHTAPAP